MMSTVPEIESLKTVIEPFLDGGRLLSYTSRYLTKPGDNYGSIMLAIDSKIQRANGDIEELPLIAKLPPLTNDMYWKLFQPERTCVSENAIYMDAAPLFRLIQLEAGIPESQLFDGIPRYYGCRRSIDVNATVVDRSAVLVLENLQTSGYKAGNRHTMFDFAHAELILKYLAQYHALPIALRKLKPDVFNKRVAPYFERFDMNSTLEPEMWDNLQDETWKDLQIVTNNNEQILEQIRNLFDVYEEWMAEKTVEYTPYTTLTHCDMWINNIMLSYDEQGVPHKLKLVDFQIVQQVSLAHDLIFFLFTSVETKVLHQHYDKLLRIYYDAFTQCLKDLHVPTTDYSYEALLEELRRVAPIELPHTIFMTKIILADNSTMPEDFKDLSLDVISKNANVSGIINKTRDIIEFAQKLKYI